MSDRIWFTTPQAADYTGYHVDTIRKAAEDGLLHGFQRIARGRWRLHRDCIDAWMSKSPCAHNERRRAS